MGTIFVLAVLTAVVALVIRGMIRDKKAGKSLQCGGDCKFCGGYCHQMRTAETAGTPGAREIRTSGTPKAERAAAELREQAGGRSHV